MSNGSDLFVFSTQRVCFLAAAAATPNKYMVAMYLYIIKSWVSHILFYFTILRTDTSNSRI